MITKQLTILNKLGIHARPAAQFVRTASRFEAAVTVEKDGEAVDGKSIMGLMMLAVGWGAVINVNVEGADESEAMKALEDLINSKFGEE
ncbi:MAG: HPr family phosphocarrier protein [Akkermansia sp.]|nr:HPr family phosphocarrier protein [Akkermansia sp.]